MMVGRGTKSGNAQGAHKFFAISELRPPGAEASALWRDLGFSKFRLKNAEGLRADNDRPGHFFPCRLSDDERRRAIDLQRRGDLLVILNF
jgi:hypothetical protein